MNTVKTASDQVGIFMPLHEFTDWTVETLKSFTIVLSEYGHLQEKFNQNQSEVDDSSPDIDSELESEVNEVTVVEV